MNVYFPYIHYINHLTLTYKILITKVLWTATSRPPTLQNSQTQFMSYINIRVIIK